MHGNKIAPYLILALLFSCYTLLAISWQASCDYIIYIVIN